MITIRRAGQGDRERWDELFRDYCRFYEWEAGNKMVDYTWQRIHDPASPVHAIVAEDADGQVVGLANYLTHESTTTMTPVCYLQDLYVDPATRAGGVGQALIDWLVAETKVQGWSRLYWNTRETNYRARGLYDKYTPHSGFVRYFLTNPELEHLRYED
jgi:GNAT superfamily N-acetyltransferase